MNLNLKTHIIPIGLTVCTLIILFTYFGVVSPLAEDYFDGQAPAWFSNLVESLYPRLKVEKHRLPVSFFLEKSHQVIWRFAGVSFLFICLICYYQKSVFFSKRVSLILTKKAPQETIKLISFCYFTFLIITSSEWISDFISMNKARSFYSPTGLYQLLPFPSILWSTTFILLMWGCSIGAIFQLKSKLNASLAIGLFIFLQGYFQCFEKTDHAYVTYIYAGIGLVIYHFTQQKAWPIYLVQLAIAICYFLAGMEKLLISHFNWASSDTFSAYLSLHPSSISKTILASSFLPTLLPILVLIFQLSFPLVFIRKVSPYILIGGIVFHLSTVWIMGIGSYLHPWVVVYVFFLLRPKHEIK